MSRVLYALLPLLGGAMIAVQAPVNARLRSVLTSPVGSATVSFATGLVILVAAAALIDRFGWLGQRPIHFGWERIVALGLLAVALVLLLRGD